MRDQNPAWARVEVARSVKGAYSFNVVTEVQPRMPLRDLLSTVTKLRKLYDRLLADFPEGS